MKQRLALTALTAAMLLSGCATTIVDTAPTTTANAPSTTTPSGSTSELLAQLQVSVGAVSSAMSISDKTKAKAKLVEVQQIWQVLQPLLAEEGEQLTQDLQRLIDLTDSAVVRNRPADADKALRFLQIIIESLA